MFQHPAPNRSEFKVIASVQEQRERYFGKHPHPYAEFEKSVRQYLPAGNDKAIVDIGCGRTAPILQKLKGHADRLIGVDLVEFTHPIDGVELHNSDISCMPFLAPESVDLVFCRSVMEHVAEPDRAFSEISRVLKPGGHFIFLTANAYDYASIVAMMIPNRYHAKIVKYAEGRAEEDTFPTQYKCNTKRKIASLSKSHEFHIEQFKYLGQYPSYFHFSRYAHYVASWYEIFLRNTPALQFLRGWILADLTREAK